MLPQMVGPEHVCLVLGLYVQGRKEKNDIISFLRPKYPAFADVSHFGISLLVALY